MSVLGLDVGTTGCKAIVLGQSGKILSKANRQYPLITPQPGWVELNSLQVWEAVLESIAEAVRGAKNDQVKAVSVSAMGDTVTPCDSNLNPIGNSIVAFDTRNKVEAKFFEEKLSRKRIFEITGQPAHPTYTITKILWLKNHAPELFAKTAYYLCYEDFITAQLCGHAVCSPSSASRTMAFDIHTNSWSQELLDLCDLEQEKLATPLASGSVAGKIKKEVAQRTGLSEDVMIVVGGHDQPCGALGCGLFEKGYALDSTGTVEVLLVTHQKAILTDEMLAANICFWSHVLPAEFCACGQILTAGAAFRWFRDNFAQTEIETARAQRKDPYDLITSAFSSMPSDLLFIPHLSGSGTPEFTPYAKGAMYGATLQTSKNDLAKAVLEGINFELKLNIDLLEKAGMSIDVLRAVGGAANSNVWMQMKADISGKKIEASQFADQCPLGAALLAGFGIGMFSNLKEASLGIQRQFHEYYPNQEQELCYEEKFARYLKFRSSMFDLYTQI